MKTRSVDRHTFEAVMRLLADHPELDAEELRARVERGAPAGRPRAQRLRPQAVGEVVSLVQAGILSKAEAKRYLDVPRARRAKASQ